MSASHGDGTYPVTLLTGQDTSQEKPGNGQATERINNQKSTTPMKPKFRPSTASDKTESVMYPVDS